MKLKWLVGGTLAAGTAAALGGAYKLFDSVIPRQDSVKVDTSEFADPVQWESYMKLITPRKEALLAREHEQVSITARDGITLRADYFPCDVPSRKFVLAFHGYTSKGISDFAAISRYYLSEGYNCLVPDLRAHGESDGDYVGFGILERFDCMGWIHYLTERFGKDIQIVLQGDSLGATTILMATGFPEVPDAVKCVVADCAFTSPYDVFAHILRRDYHLPPFPVMPIANAICEKRAGYGFRDYSTLQALRFNTRPVLFIHGSKDNFVPTRMSYENFNVCEAPKELVIIENAGHAASYYENPTLYEEKLSAFLGEWVQ